MLRNGFQFNVARFESRCVWLLAVAATFLGLTGCVKPTHLTVNLINRQTERLNMSAFAGALPIDGSVRVAVAPVADERAEKGDIGVNAEDPVRIPIHPYGIEPGEFVRASVADNLAQAGLRVVKSDAGPTRVLKLTLVRFWVEETDEYRTEVRVKATLTSPAGAILWDAVINGTNSRFGRSLSTENYQEGLSDAALQLTQAMLSSPGFQKALR